MHFSKITGSVVILSSAGRFYQREAYLRKNEVFALHGSSYIGLRRNGTSVTKLSLADYDLGEDHVFGFTKTGRLVVKGHPKFSEKTSPST